MLPKFIVAEPARSGRMAQAQKESAHTRSISLPQTKSAFHE